VINVRPVLSHLFSAILLQYPRPPVQDEAENWAVDHDVTALCGQWDKTEMVGGLWSP